MRTLTILAKVGTSARRLAAALTVTTAWVEGVTPWIGVKGLLRDFQVDMHQRDQDGRNDRGKSLRQEAHEIFT